MDGLSNEELPFAALDPLLDRHARVLFDPGTRIAEHRDPGAPVSEQKVTPAALEWSASAHAVAAIIDEGSYPLWYSPVPSIAVGARHDWAEIAAWAARLYPPPKPLPADLKKRVTAWLAIPDKESRVAAALRATQEEVRYFGIELGSNSHQPSEPSDTWERRFGDCKDKARLLVALLGALGFEAHPALVSADWGERVAELPPAASSFDHVIVQVQLSDTTLWLDPTQTQQRGPIRSLSPGPYGVGLPVSATTRELATIAIPESAVDRLKVSERFVPDPSGEQVDFSIRTEYRGASAQRMRTVLQTSGRETLARAYEDTYRRRYGELERIGELGTTEDESAGAIVVDERYILKKPWLSGTTSHACAGNSGRRHCCGDRTAAHGESHITLRHSLPGGHRAFNGLCDAQTGGHGVPHRSSACSKTSGLTFSIDARQDDDELRIDRRYRALRASLDADGFASHYDLLRQVNDLDNWRIVVSPTGTRVPKDSAMSACRNSCEACSTSARSTRPKAGEAEPCELFRQAVRSHC